MICDSLSPQLTSGSFGGCHKMQVITLGTKPFRAEISNHCEASKRVHPLVLKIIKVYLGKS